MNQANGRFCRLYRPAGALLLLLAILLLYTRSGSVPEPVAAVPTAAATDTTLPTAPPTAEPTLPPTVAPTLVPAVTPTSAPTPTPTSAEPTEPTEPTALPIALPSLNAPAAADYRADGVTLSGTGQPGATVEVWDGAIRVGTAVVGADGAWSLATKLDEGAHGLTVRTVDAAGEVLNESAVVEVTVPRAEVPAAADDLAASGEVYIVRDGDWLMKLSRRFYGDATLFTRIIDGTNAKAALDPTFAKITDLNLILVGQQLWIPAKPAGE